MFAYGKMTLATVYIIEEDEPVQSLVEEAIALVPECELIGRAGDSGAGLKEALNLRPEIVVLDLRRREVNGLEIIPLLRRELSETRILIYTLNLNDEILRVGISHKVEGFLEKGCGIEELTAALKALTSGATYYSRTVMFRISRL